MHRVQNNMLVSFHFKMYTPDGTLIADTEGQDPMTYIHGVMSTEPPGLADFLQDKEQGYQGNFVIEKAFGEALPAEQSMQSLPLHELGENVQKGMMFAAEMNGKELPMTVMDIQGDQAIVLMGHPLAGYDISFSVDIQEVRPSTPQDLEALKDIYG